MKLPYFSFYPSDFIIKTMNLTDSQVGRFIRLLCNQWANGALKIVPNDLMGYFIKTDKGFINERLEKERAKAIQKHEQTSKASHIRWDKLKDNHTDMQTHEHMDIQSESESEVDKESELKPESINIPFSFFWNDYDYKKSKAKCTSLWNKLTDEERQLVMNYIPAYKLTTPNQEYRKYPSSFLYQKTWEDDLTLTPELRKKLKKEQDERELASITREYEEQNNDN